MLSKQEAKTNHRAHSVVTLSSPRRLLLLRPLFLRRLPLHLLLRPVLPERGHRQLPSDQRFLGRGILDVFCACPNGTPLTLRQRHRQYVIERTKRPQTVMWILKAARIAASDIYVFGVSAETSGRLSTSRLLCSEAIQAVSSKNGDIIHLSPETLGWDWRAHLGRPRQLRSPTLDGVDALTILLGAPFVSDRDALCLGGYRPRCAGTDGRKGGTRLMGYP